MSKTIKTKAKTAKPAKAKPAAKPAKATPKAKASKPAAPAAAAAAQSFQEIEISRVDADPNQPRREFDEAALKELAASIKERGLLQPIVVRTVGNRYEIKMGERRWKASKLAGKKTIAAIVDDTEQTAIDRGLDQVAENEIRAGLNPMDMAEFLVRLRDIEKKSVNEICAVMEQHGMKEVSRPVISNTMRLVDLPDWSKDMVRSGQLTAAHGKYLLQAAPFPDVQKAVQQEIKQDIQWRGRVTVEETNNIVKRAMHQVGHVLNPPGWDTRAERPVFDIKICHTCEFYRKTGEHQLCFNKPEFDKKQAEAQRLIKDDPKQAIKEGKVDAETARAVVQKSKEAKASRERGAVERLNIYFIDNWLRAHLIDKALVEVAAQPSVLHNRLVAYMALGMPSGLSRHGYSGEDPADRVYLHASVDRMRDYQRPTAHAIKRVTLKQFLADDIQFDEFLQLSQTCVRAMSRDMVRRLAHHLKIDLTPLFRIDAAYLQLKSRGQVEELAKLAGIETIAGLKVSEIKNELLKIDRVAAIGVPPDIAEIYGAPFQEDIDDAKAEAKRAAKDAAKAAEEQQAAAAEAKAAAKAAKKQAKASPAADVSQETKDTEAAGA